MNLFQRELTKGLNQVFRERGYRALAYRITQSKWNSQYWDVSLDSSQFGYGFIECKRVKHWHRGVYFSEYFHANQILKIEHRRVLTGRRGFLAVRISPRTVSVISWGEIVDAWSAGAKRIMPARLKEQTRTYPEWVSEMTHSGAGSSPLSLSPLIRRGEPD